MSAVALDTLGLLEQRIARLEFRLGVQDNSTNSYQPNGIYHQQSSESISAQIIRLESGLKELQIHNTQAAEILKLRARDSEVATLLDGHRGENASTKQADAEELSVVLAAASALPKTVSDLSALQSQQIPKSKSLASLVSLTPRVQRVAAMQKLQSDEVRELRLRSAQLLARWYEQSVLHTGEQWADWEARLLKLELKLRREEHARSREEAGV